MINSNKKTTISLPIKVLIGAVLGIATGLFFGDRAAILHPIGTIYTMLLQAVVYPYIICALLSSLGKLAPNLSLRLLEKSWGFYLFLLVITFGIMLILAQAIPMNVTDLQSNQTGVTQGPTLLQLLIPENLFAALSNNYIPAVVIFCILFGVTLQFVNNKTSLFTILDTISKTCILFWNWLVQLAPYAAFALLADIAGTIKVNQLTDLGEFLILFIIGIVFLVFWILPIIITSFTNIPYKKLMTELRSALIISAATTLSVVALPYIYNVTAKLLAERDKKAIHEESKDLINTTALISYPLAQLGNFFVYLFILFASLFFNHPFTAYQHLLLPFITYLASIGSPSTSINSVTFLSGWLSLPPDTTDLYVSIMPLIRYGQVIASVMGFAFLTILITFTYFGLLKINWKKLLAHLILASVLLLMISLSIKNFIPNPDIKIYNRLNSFSLNQKFFKNVKATILPPVDEAERQPINNTEDSLFRIQRTGILRVGFNADMRPFAFFNNKNELVGYDIAYAYALAESLNAKIEFIPFTWQHLVDDLQANKFDIAMSAIYVTEQRLKSIAFTEPYLRSPMAMIVPKANQNSFTTSEKIREIPNLRIGVFNDPVLIPLVQNNFPNAKIVILPTISGEDTAQAFAQNQIDAVLWSQVQTQVWVLAHPQFTSIVPKGLPAPFLMAYMVQQNSSQFIHYLNYWLELKKNESFQQKMYNHWILVLPTEDTQPRWSILDNLLHWQKEF